MTVRLTLTIDVQNVDPTGPDPVPGPELYEEVAAALLDASPEIRGEDEEYVITRATVT